jgi:hypothetical protein
MADDRVRVYDDRVRGADNRVPRPFRAEEVRELAIWLAGLVCGIGVGGVLFLFLLNSK